MPGLLATWLRNRIGTEHGDTARFVREAKEKTGVILRADELSDFQAGVRVTPKKLKKLMEAFSDRSDQAALVTNYMLDQVPAEFRQLIEVRDVSVGKLVKRELDPVQRTLTDAETLRDNPLIASAIQSLELAVQAVRELRQRTRR